MRLSRLVLLSLATVAMAACDKNNEVTTTEFPPLAYTRIINAVPDTGGLDMRAVDQVEFSPVANNLGFRTATTYFQTESGVRHFRIFPTSKDINVTSQVLADVQVTLPASGRFTLLIAGSARANTVNLWVINDDAPVPGAGQIGVRVLNAAAGIVDAYTVASTTSTVSGTPAFSNIGYLTASEYKLRSTGSFAVRVTDASTTSVRASAAAPASPTTLPGQLPAAGRSTEGTVFSAYYFSAGAAGSDNASVTSPSVIWFVDRNPCDDPPAAACSQ